MRSNEVFHHFEAQKQTHSRNKDEKLADIEHIPSPTSVTNIPSSTSVTNIDVTVNQNQENQDRAWYFNRVIQNPLESDDYIENYENSIQKEFFHKIIL